MKFSVKFQLKAIQQRSNKINISAYSMAKSKQIKFRVLNQIITY